MNIFNFFVCCTSAVDYFIVVFRFVKLLKLVAKCANASEVVVPLKSLLRVTEKIHSEYKGMADQVCDFIRGAVRLYTVQMQFVCFVERTDIHEYTRT